MKRNPYLHNLYFRYGVWDIDPSDVPTYHVTPSIQAILASGGLQTRAERDSVRESLGGSLHPYSISLYTELDHACNTILYLFRMWQFHQGEIDLDFIRDRIPMSRIGEDTLDRFYDKAYVSNDPTSVMLDCLLFSRLNVWNPVVLSKDWLSHIQSENDFALIRLETPCKYLFLNSIPQTQDQYPSFFEFDWSTLRESFCSSTGYFCGDSISANAFYFYIRMCFLQNKHNFDFEDFISEVDASRTGYPHWLFDFCFGLSSPMNDLRKEDVLKFKDITLDFRKQQIPIMDLGEYNTIEKEIRVFRPIPSSDFKSVFSVQQVLEIAKEKNKGVEPLFWGQWDDLDTSRRKGHLKAFKFSTWEDD